MKSSLKISTTQYLNHIFVMVIRYGFNLTLNLLETKYKNSKRKSHQSCHFQNYKSHPHPCLKNGKYLKSKILQKFKSAYFQRCGDVHTNPTRFSSAKCLYMPRFKSVTYGINSITNICINFWNNITKLLEKPSTLSTSKVKKTMYRYLSTTLINS